ncbi:MAG: hypothetical protein PWQ40_1742 [Archaeoglobus sp.]|jgi:hypothetical protein|uniref:Uncharacterized protein n=2 Tax=Archaeoglobus fulgidus TaxID=2234 RepID=A0A075WFR7_ARCFL|nr:hypothetical protein AFULGI_00011690 [Archaeoglobus fulgidus DSM 8774]KUJ94052.1 MAG: hypothetical protein XD40_0764 [Archaeoglobus fulgidus]KUK05830.1 MAG: hypothetical protein XD48_1913 [Archaeoglobus fulgidus]MDI3498373.1 hypothetical protein [Archaeoglobus sp.]
MVIATVYAASIGLMVFGFAVALFKARRMA